MKNVTPPINQNLKGSIIIPADKSISHRALMFASLADGKSVIRNCSKAKDPMSTLSIFRDLGVDIQNIDENTIIVNSTGKLKPLNDCLDCGNSGTTMRLMCGILAGQPFSSKLVGDESLSKRPMKRVIEPLSLMGAKISAINNCAPIQIDSAQLVGIEYSSSIASAQVKSCMLLAGLHAEGETVYKEPYLSRNHTELMLEYMNADICSDGVITKIRPSILEPREISVVGDISSAAFFMVAASIVPNSDVVLKNVGLNPTRTGILEVLKKMGGNVEILDEQVVSGELVGDVRVKYSELKACTIEGEIIPKLIDELPVIAVLATQAEGTTIIKDAEDLRNKETDRISAIVNELKKVGADITATEDGFIINGKTSLNGGVEVDTYHDHRLAMSLYVAGLICKKEILIREFDWVDISFPEFETLMNSLM